jgi:hypothetical protein
VNAVPPMTVPGWRHAPWVRTTSSAASIVVSVIVTLPVNRAIYRPLDDFQGAAAYNEEVSRGHAFIQLAATADHDLYTRAGPSGDNAFQPVLAPR